MKLGDKGPQVVKLQKDLVSLGYSMLCHGNFNHDTTNAVRKFQLDHGIPASGQVDIRTQAKIGSLLKKTESSDTMNYPTTPMAMHVIMVVSDESDATIQERIQDLKLLFDKSSWSLAIVFPKDRVLPAVSMTAVSLVDYSGLWVQGLNEALRRCRADNTATTIYPFRAKDKPWSELVSRVWPLMMMNSHLFVTCDWFDVRSGVQRTTRKDSILWEQCPLGSVLFNISLLPASNMDAMPVLHNADHATWMFWIFNGVKPTPINWCACAIEVDAIEEIQWTLMRSQLMSSWKTPKVSALMITGKNRERYPLARVSLECFHQQTWANKEMIIINHGPEKVCKDSDPRVREIMVQKPQGTTLGDLRNLSIEAASGDWCMTWDDDDWHHPTRMENQMKFRQEDHLTTYVWQVRCSLTNMCAFYDKMPTGQQMSVLYPRSLPVRYESLEVREDTKFMNWFSSRVVRIDNHLANLGCDPTQYVRFYHGHNIWDFGHMMNGSDGQYKPQAGQLDLIPAHRVLLNSIVERFKSEEGFSTTDQHPGPPP